MTNHLKACWTAHASSKRGKAAPRWFHLVVEGRHAPGYWLHLQAPANATLGDLDSVLRRVWLECCGHLSAFEFPAKRAPRLPSDPLIDAWFKALSPHAMAEDDDAIMEERLGDRLQTGLTFFHEYDFGSTTHLALRVAGEYAAPALKGRIKLLARNDAPGFPCSVCGKPATQLCQQCLDQGSCDFCDVCARKHACGEEMFLPLVNSPRVGVCGYSGPSIEP